MLHDFDITKNNPSELTVYIFILRMQSLINTVHILLVDEYYNKKVYQVVLFYTVTDYKENEEVKQCLYVFLI